MEPKKQYGLLLPKHSAFIDSNSEDECNVDWTKQSFNESYKGFKSRQSKANIEKVLKDDPTAYEYDELYDEMKNKQKAHIVKEKKDRKSKYALLLKNQKKKRDEENERRLIRQIQKEREKEGDEYKDKEIFVTSAYKKKLEIMCEEENKEEVIKLINFHGRNDEIIDIENKERNDEIIDEENKEKNEISNEIEIKSDLNVIHIEENKKVKKGSNFKIYEKRTIGEKYDEALKRYFERKVNKLNSQNKEPNN